MNSGPPSPAWCMTLVKGKTPGRVVLVMIDGNARVCREASDNISNLAPHETNENGDKLIEMLHNTEMAAINTFWDVGHTWTSSYGTTAQIDFLLCSAQSLVLVKSADSPEGCDLSIGAKDDHRCVRASITRRSNAHAAQNKKGPQRLAKVGLEDDATVSVSREKLSSLAPLKNAAVNEDAVHVTKFIHGVALDVFGSKKDAPRQPWITSRTWEALKPLAKMRKGAFIDYHAARMAKTRVMFMLWASTVHADFSYLDPPTSAGERVPW